ncbi:IS3 family transposase [Corynebacterium pseudodiphtheriticum]|uniref:IS3 family transposase n=1 Tax=Corynebacterium pseudodiphtheriticum TaxID=37637 RepID=UPI00254A0237|nr:IS3 family transposase [Corynebacterium pseudodiphtheriticum]MDK8500939.1 IS3 family transposase [Corynebacterium pseudodiphtheriticum]
MASLPRVGTASPRPEDLSARRLRDAVLNERISAFHQANYGAYGVRKMWHALRREGINIGREHTARLMRLAGVSGKGKGRSPVTTRRSKTVDTRPDLVQREFNAEAPNELWVADITYVHTKKGFVYTAFATDAFSGGLSVGSWQVRCDLRLGELVERRKASSEPWLPHTNGD